VTPSAAIELLRELLTTEFAVVAGDVRPEASLRDDLDLDSLDATELLQRIEECAGVEIDEPDLKSLQTLGDVVELLVRARGDAHTPERWGVPQT